MIPENQVKSIIFKCGEELRAGLNAAYLTGEMTRFKGLANQLRVSGVIFEQQNPER